MWCVRTQRCVVFAASAASAVGKHDTDKSRGPQRGPSRDVVASSAQGGRRKEGRGRRTANCRWLPVASTPLLLEEAGLPLQFTPPTPSAPSASQPSRQAVPAAAAAKKNNSTVSIEQEMLKSRRLFITGDINDDSAKKIVQELLYLEAEDPSAPVTLFINSGGGLVHSGLALLDVISTVSVPIHTVAYGRCFSIAALLLSAGTPGHRRAYSNVRLMIHEPSCSYPKLPATDIMIKADELRHTQQTLEMILSTRTGRSKAEISAAVARDNYMSAAEAKEFGLVDVVLPATKQLPHAEKATAPPAVINPPPPPPHTPSPPPSSPPPSSQMDGAAAARNSCMTAAGVNEFGFDNVACSATQQGPRAEKVPSPAANAMVAAGAAIHEFTDDAADACGADAPVRHTCC